MLMVLLISALERKGYNATTSNAEKARCLPSQGGWCCLPSFHWCGAAFTPSLGMVLPFLPFLGGVAIYLRLGAGFLHTLLCFVVVLFSLILFGGGAGLLSSCGLVLLSCLGWCFLPHHPMGGPPSSFWLALLPPALPLLGRSASLLLLILFV